MKLLCKKNGNTLIATMSGELDHHNAVSIREELDHHLATVGTRNLVFDLSELRFMDSSGLGILIGRYKAVAALGGETRICAPSEQATRLIELAGIHKIITVCKTMDEAVMGL